MKTTLIDWSFPNHLLADVRYRLKQPPHPDAKPVYWRVDGDWVHKGWLMPQVGPEDAAYEDATADP